MKYRGKEMKAILAALSPGVSPFMHEEAVFFIN